MSENLPESQKDLKSLFKNLFDGFKNDIKKDSQELANYAAKRTAFLANAYGEPGFEDAVLAERDAIALKAGIIASRNAKVVDQRILGAIQGAVSIGIGMI